MSVGFSVGDLIQVSSLAFDLYRKCRDCSKDLATLSNEGNYCHVSSASGTDSKTVAGLRVVVDE
jgi:hypothetical protein